MLFDTEGRPPPGGYAAPGGPPSSHSEPAARWVSRRVLAIPDKASALARRRLASASGRTQQRDVRVADCRSVRCGVRAAWDGFLVRHEREQAPTASSGTAACPGVATLLLNARSRRAGCLLASTSGAPGGCSGVALAMRPMLVALCDTLHPVRAGSTYSSGIRQSPAP